MPQPIIVIRTGDRPIPTVAAVAAAEGWPVLPSDPIGGLLRALFLAPPDVAVVETSASERALLRTLRERRPETALVAVSEDVTLELMALASGVHAWLCCGDGEEALRMTTHALRRDRLQAELATPRSGNCSSVRSLTPRIVEDPEIVLRRAERRVRTRR